MLLLRILPLIGVFAFAWSSPLERDPGRADNQSDRVRQILNKYCLLDFEGARLNSSSWRQVASLVDWEAEPGWDQIVAVSTFRVTSATVQGQTARVAVAFDVLGYVEGESVVRQRKREVQTFDLTLKQGRWRISGPVIPPHVSIASIERHFRTAMRGGTGSEQRTYQLLLRRLQALRE